MANHPSRGKPSREALELIAHYARHGIALEPEQQAAAATVIRASRAWDRIQTERANGDRPIRQTDQAAWRAQLDAEENRAEARIAEAAKLLPHIRGVCFDGTTVLLLLEPNARHLNKSWDGCGIAVPRI